MHGTLPDMGVRTYMVRGETREDCQAALDELCQLLQAVPTMRPSDVIGPGWVARAVRAATAPAGESAQATPG